MKKTTAKWIGLVLAGALLAGCASAAAGSTVSSEVAPVASPSGTVTPKSTTSSSASTASVVSVDIGEEEAKRIALEHAGLAEADVTFVRVNLDWDDGRQEYEVEFYKDNTEYDYDIDAATGEIRSFDSDAEYYTPGQTTQNSGVSSAQITEDQALSAALAHAGLSQSDISRLKVELDYDDGRTKYELEWNVDRTEYSYEVDASTGEIISYEKELD